MSSLFEKNFFILLFEIKNIISLFEIKNALRKNNGHDNPNPQTYVRKSQNMPLYNMYNEIIHNHI